VLHLDPKFSVAHSRLALCLYHHRSDINGAMKHFHIAIYTDENNAEAHTNLGGVLFNEGNLSDAKSHLTKAIKLKPTDMNAHFNLGNVYLAEDKQESAIKHYKVQYLAFPCAGCLQFM